MPGSLAYKRVWGNRGGACEVTTNRLCKAESVGIPVLAGPTENRIDRYAVSPSLKTAILGVGRRTSRSSSNGTDGHVIELGEASARLGRCSTWRTLRLESETESERSYAVWPFFLLRPARHLFHAARKQSRQHGERTFSASSQGPKLAHGVL